jgi:hypothetical protein
MRVPDATGTVTMSLRGGADGVDDETLWGAVIAAVEGAADDRERWMLGDGVIDESVSTRTALTERWRAEFEKSAAVRSVYYTMWSYLDGLGLDRGWWSR